jgi:hypothetical protein
LKNFKLMKKSSLTVVILVILAVIVAVIAVDFLSNRPDRRGKNPYALEVDSFRVVDPALVSHHEVRDFSLGSLTATTICCREGRLYIAGDSSLVVIGTDGSSVDRFGILPGPTSIHVTGDAIFVGYTRYIAKYDIKGGLLQRWDDLGDRAVITNLAGKDQRIYAADAGNRRVLIYDVDGDLKGEFEGEAETEAGHGFIVPSANFDLAVNSFGELWVVNPGKHAIENYTDDGRLRGFWENSSVEIEGFHGCCNPARIAIMEDGSFVTSEKVLVRIKIYDPSGKLRSVVAAPDLFKEGGKAPDVCIDSAGVVYALDLDRNLIRVFEPKGNG